MTTPTVRIEERLAGDVTVLALNGDVVFNGGGAVVLKDKVLSLIAAGRRKIVLDLGDVSYVDSAGLVQLVQIHASAKDHGGAVRLANVTKRMKDLLVVTKLVTVFDSYDDDVDAIRSFSTPKPRRCSGCGAAVPTASPTCAQCGITDSLVDHCHMCAVTYRESELRRIRRHDLGAGLFWGALVGPFLPALYLLVAQGSVAASEAMDGSLFTLNTLFGVGGGILAGITIASSNPHALGHVLTLGFQKEYGRWAFHRKNFADLFLPGMATRNWFFVVSSAIILGLYVGLGPLAVTVVTVPLVGVTILLVNPSTRRTVAMTALIVGVGTLAAFPEIVGALLQGADLEVRFRVLSVFAAVLIVAGWLLLRSR